MWHQKSGRNDLTRSTRRRRQNRSPPKSATHHFTATETFPGQESHSARGVSRQTESSSTRGQEISLGEGANKTDRIQFHERPTNRTPGERESQSAIISRTFSMNRTSKHRESKTAVTKRKNARCRKWNTTGRRQVPEGPRTVASEIRPQRNSPDSERDYASREPHRRHR